MKHEKGTPQPTSSPGKATKNTTRSTRAGKAFAATINSDPESAVALERVRRRLQVLGEVLRQVSDPQRVAMQTVTEPLTEVLAMRQAMLNSIGEAVAEVAALGRFDKIEELVEKYPEMAPSLRELGESIQQAKQNEERRRQSTRQRLAEVGDRVAATIRPQLPAFDDSAVWKEIRPLEEQIETVLREALAEIKQEGANPLPQVHAERGDQFMAAQWFDDKFGIRPERLRAARRDGRLRAIDVGAKRPRYRYSVLGAMQLWPDEDIYLPDANS